MSFTKQSILAIVIAIVASDQAQADWQSWISGQSLKNLGNSIALELGRVFYKAPKCIYENTSKSEKVVGACALFGTVGTGYYFYKKYQNVCKQYKNARNVHQNCDTKYNKLQRKHDNLDERHENFKAAYTSLQRQHDNLDKRLQAFQDAYTSLNNEHKELSTIHQSCNDTGLKPNSNNSPKSSPA